MKNKKLKIVNDNLVIRIDKKDKEYLLPLVSKQ